MSPTPELQDLIRSVRDEAPAWDLLAQLATASEYAGGLSRLGDRLLDHFVQECRQAGMSWAELSGALGVSKQAAHKRFTATPGRYERFTDRARSVLTNAVEQAKELGHPNVEPEHLLLAQYSQPESVATLVLARLGVERDHVLAAVLERTPRAERSASPRAIPFSPDTKAVLQATLDEALNLAHNYIGTEHLLLALQRGGTDAASEILTASGADFETLRSVLMEFFDEHLRRRAAQDPTAQ
jgi:hypothetical protein